MDRRPPNRSKSEPTLNMKSPAQSDILNEFHDNDDVESYSEDTETKSYSDDDCGSSNEVGDDYCDIRENMQGDRTDEEEHLLNMHMSVIQEKAELLTKESQLLNTVQGDSIDMEEYATQLEDILHRKTELVLSLQKKLGSFREQMKQNGVCNNLGSNSGFASEG